MTRRRFLRDIGVSVGAVPLLAGLDSLYAKADVPVVPKKRFVMMYTPNGGLYSAWRIPQAGTNIDITANGGTLLNDPSLTLQPLYKNAANLLILDRLSMIAARPVYQDVANLKPGTKTVDGIDHPGGHQKGCGSMLTGQVLIGGAQNFGSAGLANGISVDQVIANQLFKSSSFPSLQLAVMGTNDLYAYNDREVDKVVSYTGPSAPLIPISDPFVLFRTLFGNAGNTGNMTASGPTPQQLIDKSVLDAVQADFTRLQPKLSSADWQLLQQHQTNVRDIEGQLTKVVAAVSCASPVAPAAPAGVNTTDPKATLAWTEPASSYPVSGAMLMNIMVQALACGLTNVVTFQWAHSEDNLSYDFLGLGSNAGLPASQANLTGVGHHNMSHERDPNLVYVDQFYATQFNSMITQMNAIPDSGTSGSLLDNSVLLWTSGLSDGSAHISDNAYFTLAGSNGGYFKQGQLLRFNNTFTPLPIPAGSDPNTYFLTNDWYTGGIQKAAQDQATIGTPDLSNNDLLASILDSFGLDITKVMPSATDPRFFHGLLPGVKAGS
jgi:hypothetical protein